MKQKTSQVRLDFICRVIMIIAGYFIVDGSARADDWPQWRGPNRDGHSAETGLLREWPATGPPLVYKSQGTGIGYSAPSIVGNRMFLTGDHGEEQYALCFDARSGQELWRVAIGPKWIDPHKYHGARCTPTIENGRAYVLGAHGDLFALRTSDGNVIWKLNLLERFETQNIKWGFSESPLLEGDKLVVMPGGERSTIAALDKRTGATIWTSHNPERNRREPASYASLVASTIDGERQIIAVTEAGGFAARAGNGQFLWQIKMGGASSNTTPLVSDGRVFITGAYGPGCSLVDASQNAASERQIYLNRNLRNHVGGVVLIDGHIYGCSGAFGGEILVCLNFDTGEIVWKDRGIGDVAVMVADGMLYCRGAGHRMQLVDPSPDGYKPVSEFRTPVTDRKPTWAHPVIANGHLYLREQDSVYCYDIRRRD